MKAILFAQLCFLLLAIGNNLGQTESSIPGINETVVRYIDGNGVYQYNMTGGSYNDDIGYHANSYYGLENVYRSEFRFPLSSIPPNATITSANLQYICSDFGVTNVFAVCKLTQSYSYNYLWNAIQNSPLLFYDLSYNGGETPSTQALIDAVNAARSNGWLFLGSASQAETNNQSYAKLQLTLKIIFTIPVISITADNNFTAVGGSNHGTMVIDGVNQTIPLTGYTFQKTVGQTLTLSANSPQNDNQSYQRIWHTGATNTSDWRRNGELKSNNQTYPFPVTADDNGKRYVANLRKNFAISRNDQTEFDGTISQGVLWNIVEQNSGQISAPSQHPINNLYNFVGWTDGNGDNPRTIWPDNNQTYTALYKMVHKSNDETAYSNNSQRKFIRTPDGYYHHVYESMSDVWYERSTNEGQSWQLVYNTAVRYGNFIKCTQPSLGYYVDNQSITHIYLIFVIKDNTGDRLPLLEFTNYNFNTLETYTESAQLEPGRTFSNPVVTCAKNGEIFCAWETQLNQNPSSLRYAYGKDDLTGYINWYNSGALNFTANSSTTPSVSTSPNMSNVVIHLTWKEGDDINYCNLIPNSSNVLLNSDIKILSRDCGYPINFSPSISAMDNGTCRVSWIGFRDGEPDCGDPLMVCEEMNSPIMEQKVVFCDPDYEGHYWNFGNNVQSVNINKSVPRYVIAWGEADDAAVQFVDSYDLGGTIYTTPQNMLTGKWVQVSNAENDKTKMRIMSFYTAGLPYGFNSDKCYLAKPNTVNIGSGREGVVSKDSAKFFFALGDIKVNGVLVKMLPIDDTVVVNNKQKLNFYMMSEAFSLTDNSDLLYSVQYGITDSSAAVSVLDDNDFVSFKVELRDDQADELLGLFDNITYNETNVAQYNNIAYQVNTQGIGSRTVRLKLVTDNNIEPKYSIADRYAEGNALLKTNFKRVSFQGSLAVKEYVLEQNYPNPFNPTTTINYQLKEDGLVTLKIYDILGSEIKTLVNEDKKQGRYSYNFNASDLASGVYIYQLRVNGFVSSKKLLLVK